MIDQKAVKLDAFLQAHQAYEVAYEAFSKARSEHKQALESLKKGSTGLDAFKAKKAQMESLKGPASQAQLAAGNALIALIQELGVEEISDFPEIEIGGHKVSRKDWRMYIDGRPVIIRDPNSWYPDEQ